MHALIERDLVDEYRIWVHPLILGRGRRLFRAALEADLELVDVTTLANGIVVLHYRRAGS
jgi:dihydrofolate reductase